MLRVDSSVLAVLARRRQCDRGDPERGLAVFCGALSLHAERGTFRNHSYDFINDALDVPNEPHILYGYMLVPPR